MTKKNVSNGERMAVIETKVENLANKLDEHTTEQREEFSKIFNKLDEHIKMMNTIFETKADKDRVTNLENKYENINKTILKWGGAITVLTFILTFILTKIYKGGL